MSTRVHSNFACVALVGLTIAAVMPLAAGQSCASPVKMSTALSMLNLLKDMQTKLNETNALVKTALASNRKNAADISAIKAFVKFPTASAVQVSKQPFNWTAYPQSQPPIPTVGAVTAVYKGTFYRVGGGFSCKNYNARTGSSLDCKKKYSELADQVFKSTNVTDGKSWSAAPSYPYMVGVSQGVVYNSKLYVAGGIYHSGGKYVGKLQDVYAFDGKSWSAAPKLNYKRQSAGMVVYKGKILVIGGSGEGGKYRNDVESFADGDTKWTVLAAKTKSRRSIASAVVFRGKVLYIAGRAYDTSAKRNTVEEYDGVSWKLLSAKLNIERSDISAAVLNDRVYVAGGYSRGDQRLASVEVFDGSSWRLVASMHQARVGHNLVAYHGLLYVIGGSSNNDNVDGIKRNSARTEVYRPPPAPPTPAPTARPTSLQLLYDASTLKISDGSSLSSLADTSGHSGRGDLYPIGTVTYRKSGMNGKPCLYLSGAGTALDTKSKGSAIKRQTYVMVLKYDPCNCAKTCGQAVYYLWDFRNDGTMYCYSHSHKFPGTKRWINGQERKYQCSTWTQTGKSNEPIIFVEQTSKEETGRSMTLFARYTHGENIRVLFGEVQVHAGVLSDTDRKTLECSLAKKWGVTSLSYC